LPWFFLLKETVIVESVKWWGSELNSFVWFSQNMSQYNQN
jgi:hypothetical protein